MRHVRIHHPYDKTLSAIAVNKKGAVFVASGNAIYYVDTVKKNLIVFAQGADFDFISGLSFDQYDNLYVCDQSRREIKMVDSSGQVSWIAGFASQYGHSDGFVYNATFKYPIDLFMDTLQDCIYIADDQMIRKIDLNSSWVSTLAGDTIIGYADGKGKAARFRNITSICADKNNNIFTAELGQVIRRVSNDSNVVTRAGTTVQGYKDGPASTAQFNAPYGICIDETGNLFVSEAGNDVLRKIRAQKNIISSISSYSILTAKKRISVYPNPFGETSTVDLSEIKKSVNDNLSFHLFSVLGKEVMIRSNISGNKLLIEKKDMAVGIYLYKVVLNEKCIEDGKLIIQ
ncbi:MAG: T9SS type A sorting domain-containing protein [Bacteroidetes bacterium]|nr:T9SS type A sorting domain-containing protein [Bacteroidota bacterium]